MLTGLCDPPPSLSIESLPTDPFGIEPLNDRTFPKSGHNRVVIPSTFAIQLARPLASRLTRSHVSLQANLSNHPSES